MASKSLDGYFLVQPHLFDDYAVTPQGHPQSSERRYRCNVCGKRLCHYRTGRARCSACQRQLKSWRRAMQQMGMAPRCPAKLREQRLQLYEQRAQAELDLFESPLS